MTLELILGPMFCGKTEELIRRVDRETVVKKKVIAFKPSLDRRYSSDFIVSHSKARLKAVPLDKTSKIAWHLRKAGRVDVIAFDEIQFFDEGMIEFCRQYANDPNIEVIASGLNLDFRREPFKFKGSKKHIGEIMPLAHITNLRAKCTYEKEGGQMCDHGADYTQRLVDGKPAHYNDPLILVGASEAYAARCLSHHFVPGKDRINIHYWKSADPYFLQHNT